MNIGELLIISIALSIDAATYAFAYGLVLRERRIRAALALALSVGFFQAFMPLMGYLGGVGLREAVHTHAQWLVFAIFAALGTSVIYKAWRGGEEAGSSSPLGIIGLLLVGLATSIDAFAVGICMALGHTIGEHLTPAQVGLSAGVIGLTTFLAALAAFRLSRMLHHLPERWLQTGAGIILISLGVSEII